ncbi:MAG: insulinase family protein [Alphaproteobacteria bacterium]|nr:insulinase family protein [Alphaproteobacteria bacterium]
MGCLVSSLWRDKAKGQEFKSLSLFLAFMVAVILTFGLVDFGAIGFEAQAAELSSAYESAGEASPEKISPEKASSADVTPVPPNYPPIYNAKTTTLENGLKVVVIENHRAPVVHHMIWYKVGSADEPRNDGVSGAAHFLEHLMFKGTKAVGAGEFSRLIAGIGGQENAFTSWDYTAFFQTIPAKYLRDVMALESDRMINLTLAEKDIESERNVIIEERRGRTDNDPRALFNEQMRAMLFVNAPYAEPIIGWRDEMSLLKRADVMNYYTTWYAPNNAILVVSGDAKFDDVVRDARATYGLIPAREVPPHLRARVPQLSGGVAITHAAPDVPEDVYIKAWIVPNYADNPKNYYGLGLLTQILANGADSMLYQEFVVKRKIATSVELSYNGDARGDGELWLYAIPAGGTSPEALGAALDEYFKTIWAKKLMDDEMIERGKTRLIDAADYARDSLVGPAMEIGQMMAIGMSLNDIENWRNHIAALTPQDVDDAYRDVFLGTATAYRLPVTGIMKHVPATQPHKIH